MPKDYSERIIDWPYTATVRSGSITTGGGGGGGGGGGMEVHDLSGEFHIGLLDWADLNKTGSSLADLAVRPHSALTGIGANDHHNQAHVLATNAGLGADHTISGATAGHVLRASAATAAAFAQLQHGDLGTITANQHHNQVHGIVSSDHTVAGSQWDVIGLSATNTLAVLTPSSDPGAGPAILRTGSGGGLSLDTDLFVVNASDDSVRVKTSLFVANAATQVVAVDSPLFVVNVAANTITMDNTLFVLDRSANTITSNATWTFDGSVTSNLHFTHNTGTFTHNSDPQVNANLDFIGATPRLITSASNLTIAPTGDLRLDPSASIMLPDDQQLRTDTHNDFVAGITGLRHFDTGGGVRQLTIGKIKADELFVRFFTADEDRVNRGAEFWARSYGIVETDFVTPADEATVDVWFEEAAELAGAAKLFLPDNWIQFRTVDAGTNLVVTTVWFQVVDADGAATNDYVQRQAAGNGPPPNLARQQWRLRRKSGGSTGVVIKKGNVGVDFGKPFSVTTPTPGQGVVHLSALQQDGGPFVQIQTFESVSSDVPQFKNRVRMGNLSGFAGVASDLYGFGAGDDGSVTPAAGFRGMLVDPTNGLRLYNSSFDIYQAGTLNFRITQNQGILLRQDSSEENDEARVVGWYADPGVVEPSVAYITAWEGASSDLMSVTSRAQEVDGRTASLTLRAIHGNLPTWAANESYILIRSGGAVDYHATTNYFDGELGIGTSSPSESLHVVGNALVTGNATVSGVFFTPQVRALSGAGLLLTDDGGSQGIFIEDGGELYTNADVTVGPGTGAVNLRLNGGAGVARSMSFQTGGVLRWLHQVTNAAETGSNAGSNYALLARDDAGNALWVPWVIERATGNTVWGGNSSAATTTARLQILQPTTTGNALHVYRNLVSNAQMVSFHQDHASDTNTVLRIQGDGTGNILDLFDGSSMAMTILDGGRTGIGLAGPASRVHIYESSSLTDASIGLTIENAGTGDSVVQFVGQVRRWVVGIDESEAGDPLSFAAVTGLGNAVMRLHSTGILTLGDTVSFTPAASASGEIAAGVTISSINDDFSLYPGSGSGHIFMIAAHDGSQFRSMIETANASSPVVTFVKNVGRVVIGSAVASINSSAKLTHHNAEAGANNIHIYGYGGTGTDPDPVPSIIFRGATNTAAAPGVLGAQKIVGHISAGSYSGGGAWAPGAAIQFITAQAQTSTNRGTYIRFQTTENSIGSSAGYSPVFEIRDTGRLWSSYSYANVVGNTNTGLFVDNVGLIGKSPSSSRRFKENFGPLPAEYGVELILAVEPCSFTRVGYAADEREVGIIAEELHDAGARQLVRYDLDGEVDGIRHEQLIYPLWAALRNALQRIASLEAQLAH